MLVKLFKNGPSKICGRQPLKNLKWYGLLSSWTLIWQSVSSRPNPVPVWKLPDKSPHIPTCIRWNFSIGCFFHNAILEASLFLSHHWNRLLMIVLIKYRSTKAFFEYSSAFVLSCCKYFSWAGPYFLPGMLDVNKSTTFALYLVDWLVLLSSLLH